MNKNQYETITELIAEHDEYVAEHGIGNSSFKAVFEDRPETTSYSCKR